MKRACSQHLFDLGVHAPLPPAMPASNITIFKSLPFTIITLGATAKCHKYACK